MNRIVLQPAGGTEAKKHFADTIIKPVSLNTIHGYVSDERYKELVEIYPDGSAPTWGVVPGVGGVNIGKWDKMKSGDGCIVYIVKRFSS